MTQLLDVDAPVYDPAEPVLDPALMTAATERYLSNPLFAAAQFGELVLDDNPYRRPVRPDDIRFVDFSAPLSRTDYSQLSGLMGHRMLLNIHDSGKRILPVNPTPAKWRDFTAFYSPANRLLGNVIRPYLEQHLFGFVQREAAERTIEPSVAAIAARVRELRAQMTGRMQSLHCLVKDSAAREPMLQMLAIQVMAAALNSGLPLQSGSTPAMAPLIGSDRDPRAALEDVARPMAMAAGLKYELHSYFQYYLPSTLAMMNYLNGAAEDPRSMFSLCGAMTVQSCLTQSLHDADGGSFLELVDAGSLVPAMPAMRTADETAIQQMLRGLAEIGGDFALTEFARGLEEYAVLSEVHHDDMTRQFAWIDAMPAHHERGRRLQQAIMDHNIEVALDTFSESWEECSTTHVHDDDRLLVIETGEMDFWNCYGVHHTYRPGDMTFIPKHRLHGSVVQTGHCLYHQPVITRELLERHG